MKYIIALSFLILSRPSFAQFVNLQKCGVENVGTSIFSHREICEGDTGSECVPFSGGFCESKEVIDEEVNDKPIYGERQNVVACTTEQDCEDLRGLHCKIIPDSFFFYAMNANNGFEAYCTKIIGYTKVKTGKKLLVENEQKLKAHLKKIKDEKDAKDLEKEKKRALKEKIKGLKKSDLTSNAKTVDALMDIIELLKE